MTDNHLLKMAVTQHTFSILITTKNRLTDLVFTLDKIKTLLNDNSVACVVYDDGSTDGTYEYVKNNFPNIQLRNNAVSKGYIFCRNKMLNETKADYAISLDDDAHFVTDNPLEIISTHFAQNTRCGLIAMRIFWGLNAPVANVSNEKSLRVQGFVGCAHVWRMSAWHDIPNYPEWFVFYGEENFASYQLFKENWEVHYLPQVLVNHRVDVKSRKVNTDYSIRLRRSLRSGWYLFFLFYPIRFIPGKIVYSLWMQIKQKVFKGDFKSLQAILLSMFDLIINMLRIIKNSNRLTKKEYEEYIELPETKIYWNPEK
jgi:glycosyltransferase involved in cell wall biosynthesis